MHAGIADTTKTAYVDHQSLSYPTTWHTMREYLLSNDIREQYAKCKKHHKTLKKTADCY